MFDQGPHIMFSHDPLLLDCMVASLGDNVHRCRRNNRVAIAGTLAGYPLENDLAALPLPLRSDALMGVIRARERTSEPEDLAAWFEATFGDVLVAAYFRPYNEKVWNVPLERLSLSWAERIPRPPLEDVVRGAMGERPDGYLHQLHYCYPLRGGYSALMDAWASGLRDEDLVLGAEATRVVPGAGGVLVETPERAWRFDRVVSTIPIRRLVEIVPRVPPEVSAAVSRLVVNPMVIATLGFEGRDRNQFTAVYVPDADYLVNRVSYPAVFSPGNAPPGCFSVQAEITCPRGSELLARDDASILGHVLDGLRHRRLAPADREPVFRHVQRLDHGYVVHTRGWEDDVGVAAAWFASQGIVVHGRFGSHRYLNVDGCLRSSIDLARAHGSRLTDGEVLRRFQALASG